MPRGGVGPALYLARGLDLLDETLEDRVVVATLELELRRGADAVAKRGQRHSLDVVGGDEVAAFEQRGGPPRPYEGDAAAGAGARDHACPGACRAHEAHRVIQHRIVDPQRR